MLNTISTQVNVTVEFGQLKHIMNWCRDNCRGNWSITNYQADCFQYGNAYEFSFDDEHDVTAFSLRWT
jgi:hypothetical protein